MLNQLTLVGRLVRNPEVVTTNDTKYSHITIAVPRSYKNINDASLQKELENVEKAFLQDVDSNITDLDEYVWYYWTR